MECNDKKCPFHGGLKARKRSIEGTVIKTDVHRSATVEFEFTSFIQKYNRYAKKRTRLHVHNPACISAKPGDEVILRECRPLSKTKNFVIYEKIGKAKLFEDLMEARESAKAKVRKKKEETTKKDEEQ